MSLHQAATIEHSSEQQLEMQYLVEVEAAESSKQNYNKVLIHKRKCVPCTAPHPTNNHADNNNVGKR